MIDKSDIAGLAAEYVLGTLPYEERQAVIDAKRKLPALNDAITAWEKRLAPLVEAIPPAPPSADLLPKIERHLFGTIAELPDRTALEHQISTWRIIALAASIALVIVSSITLQMPKDEIQQPAIVILQKEAASPAFLASLDDKAMVLTVRPLADAPEKGKSYQLWLITSQTPTPRSLGVLHVANPQQIQLAGITLAELQEATLAISLEPLGGSPTGAPTGPVVFSGKFIHAKTL